MLGGVFGASLVVSAYFSWVAWDTLLVAADNVRLVSVFQADEYTHVVLLRDALANGTFQIHFPHYGYFYFNVVLLPLAVITQLVPMGETGIMIALRLGSLIPAALATIMTFVLAERYWGRAVAWVATLGMVLVNSSVTYWAVTSHPDALQMLALVSSVYCACRFVEQRQPVWRDRAAVAAGLAFATKYAGLFLLPIIVAAGFMRHADAENERQRAARALRIAAAIVGGFGLAVTLYGPWTDRDLPGGISLVDAQRIASGALLSSAIVPRFWNRLLSVGLWHPGVYGALTTGALFVASFAVASPFSLVNLTFLRGMMLQSGQINRGYFFAATGGPMDWFDTIARPDVLGLLGTLLAAAGLALVLRDAIRARPTGPALSRAVVGAWVVLMLAFLLLRVNDRVDRYLMILVPGLFILAADAAVRLARSLRNAPIHRVVRAAGLAVIALAATGEAWRGLSAQARFVKDRATIVERSETVRTGNWMAANLPHDARVLYDFYSYVPPVFDEVRASWGMTASEVAGMDADVIVVSSRIRSRYARAADSASYQWGPAAFLPAHEFYRDLERGAFPFVPVHRAEGITVYRRRAPGG